MQCPGSDARMWVEAMDIANDNAGQVTAFAAGGRLYVKSMRIKNEATDGIAVRNEGGILWLNAQKISASGAGGQAVSLLDGVTDADIMEIEDAGDLGTAIACEFGTHTIKNVRYVAGENGGGVTISGGTLTLENCLIDTSANASVSPITKSGGTLILKDCTLIAEATQDSISAPTAQAVSADGSNTIYQPVNANVTVVGNMQENTGVAGAGEVPIAKADGTWEWGATVVQVTGLTLLDTGWTLVGSFYEYDLADANILSTSIVEVIPDNADIAIVQAAVFLPRTDSSAGSVKVYATNEPTVDIGVTINIYYK